MADSRGSPADVAPMYEGEEQVGTVVVGDTTVVVTTHRLLVRPERDGAGRRAVDRANLGAIQVQTQSTRGFLWSGLEWGLLGLFLLSAWQVVPVGDLVSSVEQPIAPELGGLSQTVQILVELLALLDEAFLLAGVVALGWGAWRFVQYVRSRDRCLEIEVHGASPVRLAIPESEGTVERLRELVAMSSATDR